MFGNYVPRPINNHFQETHPTGLNLMAD